MTITQQPRVAPPPSGRTADPRSTDTPVRLTEAVARSAVEIVRDLRPAASLSRVVTPEIAVMLERRAVLTRRLRGAVVGTSKGSTPGARRDADRARVVIRGVRTCVVNESVVEASAVVHERGRARFLAMRWELRPRGWRVTVLEMG